ncbi:MAG: hypothetical protein V4592_15960 [Bacteroidota bacterium]
MILTGGHLLKKNGYFFADILVTRILFNKKQERYFNLMNHGISNA